MYRILGFRILGYETGFQYEFVDLYGDINLYTCQGNKKLNDLMKTYWFRSNNKKENELVQLMQNRNRIEFNKFYQDINESKNN